MKVSNVSRILLAAPSSGSGKTTVVMAVTGAFKRKGLGVRAFKVGPDYIDPMFHRAVTGVEAHNLDLFLCGGHGKGEDVCKEILSRHGENADICVLEGAMGFYDGLGLSSDFSAYDTACRLETPVVLVVSGRGSALSTAAVLKGLAEFRSDSHVVGFIVNHVKPGVYRFYKELWEKESGLKAYGCFPDLPEGTLESRHLGLVTADEIVGLQHKARILAEAALEYIDLDGLAALAEETPPISYIPKDIKAVGQATIAVARDEAFCFYYEDGLNELVRYGAKIVEFSPLHDKQLPPCDGLYIGGGYPELYAETLSNNGSMRLSIQKAVQAGLPCVGECGGYMYLAESFRNEGTEFSMVHVVPGKISMTNRLVGFGYAEMTAHEDNLLCSATETMRAHEFHYSQSTDAGAAFTITKRGRRAAGEAIFAKGRIFAGYPHFHFSGETKAAERFVRACVDFRKREK